MGEGLIRSQLQHPNTTIKHLNPELGFQFQLQKDIPKYIMTTNLTCSTEKTKVFTIPNQNKSNMSQINIEAQNIKPGKLQRHTKHLNRSSKYYPHLACDPSQSIEAQPQHKTTNIHQNKRINVNPCSTTSISKDK
jgi:hypothetical protein